MNTPNDTDVKIPLLDQDDPHANISQDGPGNAERTSPVVLPRSRNGISFFDDYEIVDGAFLTALPLAGGRRRLTAHGYSKNGDRVVLGFSDGLVQVLCVHSDRSGDTARPSHSSIKACRFAGTTEDVIVCVDGKGVVIVWDTGQAGDEAFQEYHCMTGMEGFDRKFAFSKDGQYLMCTAVQKTGASGSECGSRHRHCNVDVVWFDVGDGTHGPIEVNRISLQDLGHLVLDVPYSPTGRAFLMDVDDHTFVWPDFKHGNVKFSLKGGYGKWSQDGRRIVTFDKTRKCSYIWEMDQIMSLNVTYLAADQVLHDMEPVSVVQGGVVAMCGDRVLTKDPGNRLRITVWDIEKGSITGHLDGHEDDRWCSQALNYYLSCVSDDAKLIATCIGGIVTIWDAHSCGRLLETHIPTVHLDKKGHRGLSFSPDGRKLFVLLESKCLVYTIDGFQGSREALWNIPQGESVTFCKFSNTAIEFGFILSPRHFTREHNQVLVLNMADGSVSKLVQDESNFAAFSFSLVGDDVATLSENGQLALWPIKSEGGDVRHSSVVCNINTAMKDTINCSTFPRSVDISFTCDAFGKETVVILWASHLLWIEKEGQVVDAVQALEGEECIAQHRFSSDGQKCIISTLLQSHSNGLDHGIGSTVWDLVARCKLQDVALGLPSTVVGEWKSLHWAQQISLDGHRATLGINQEGQPWLVKAHSSQALESRKYKLSACCTSKDIGECSILGPVGVISESGGHVVTCKSDNEWRLCVVVESLDCGNEKMKATKKVVYFPTSEDGLKGALFLSGNGKCIAWVTEKSIRLWDAYCHHRSIPSYKQLTLHGLSHNQEAIEGLLELHGKNILNYPDSRGWSLIARAVQDQNVGCVGAILNWAGENCDGPICLERFTGEVDEATNCTNMMELAFCAGVPECIQVVINGMLDKTIVACNVGGVLSKSLNDLMHMYPSLFSKVIHNERLLQQNGEVRVPDSVLEGKDFLVCTHDQLCPDNIEALWSESTPETNMLMKVSRCIGFSKAKDEPVVGSVMVPAQSCVIPLAGLGQFGQRSILGEVLIRKQARRWMSSLPLRCAIECKWEQYGRLCASRSLFWHCLLIVAFTFYSMVLGSGCMEPLDVLQLDGLLCAVPLGISMVLGVHGLFIKTKQAWAYCAQGRRGCLYFWTSPWNAIDILGYVLITIAIPSLHLLGSSAGLSWCIPIAYQLILWRLLYFAQAYQPVGPVILMILGISQYIMVLLLIVFGALWGFSVGFFVVYRESEEHGHDFGTIIHAFLSTFSVVFGNFDLPVFYEGSSPGIAVVLFVSCAVTMAVLFASILIIALGEGFDRLKDREDSTFAMARASVMQDMESMLSRRTRDNIRRKTGSFVHVLIPKDQCKYVPKWQGTLLSMERRLGKLLTAGNEDMAKRVDTIEQQVMDVGVRTTGMSSFIEKRVSSIESGIAALKTQITNLERAAERK